MNAYQNVPTGRTDHMAYVLRLIDSMLGDFSDLASHLGDHVVWLHRNNLIRVDNIESWQRFSLKSWLYSVILNLIRNYKTFQSSRGVNTALLLDTVKNASDFWIPFSLLGHGGEIPTWFVGIMGVISSVLSALPLLDSSYRL